MKPNATPGVSGSVKASVALALVVAAVLIWYLRRDATPSHGASPPAAATPGSAAKPRPADRVQRVTPEERKRVAQQIRDARAGRASAPERPSLPAAPPSASAATPRPTLDSTDVETFKTTMRTAMQQVIPYLADCYDQHSQDLPATIDVRAKLVLTGDPDVGTLIDTEGLGDGSDAPLHAGFDACLRDALAGLELPPLAEGEEVRVTYPFMFAR